MVSALMASDESSGGNTGPCFQSPGDSACACVCGQGSSFIDLGLLLVSQLLMQIDAAVLFEFNSQHLFFQHTSRDQMEVCHFELFASFKSQRCSGAEPALSWLPPLIHATIPLPHIYVQLQDAFTHSLPVCSNSSLIQHPPLHFSLKSVSWRTWCNSWFPGLFAGCRLEVLMKWKHRWLGF